MPVQSKPSINFIIPTELVRNIIGEVVNIDRKSAKICALVCKAWLPHSDLISSRADFLGNDAFNRWVQENGKHINATVKTIHYHHKQSPNLPSKVDLRYLFPNVHKLSLGGVDLGELGRIPDFKALDQKVRSLRLYKFKINISQLADYLRSFPDLESLTIQYPDFRDDQQELNNPERLPELLSELHLRFGDYNPGQFLHMFPSSLFSLSNITVGNCGYQGENLRTGISNFLGTQKDTLTKLNIHSEHPPLHIGRMTFGN